MNRSERERQLELRLERERRARRQAEVVAERGLRELWDVNRQLHDRVEARAEQIERVFDGAERAVAAWADELDRTSHRIEEAAQAGDADLVRDEVDYLRRVVDLGRRQITPKHASAAPRTIADELLARWQRRSARRGQLLEVHAERDDAVTSDWVAVVAVGEVLVGAAVLYGGPGVVQVDLRGSVEALELVLEIPPGPDSSAASPFGGTTSMDVAVSVAQHLVDRVGGTVTGQYGESWRVVATFGSS